mmetsp:Transcript_7213/g.20812  ORF Transcript_7213/g.20812 Transcript_7213/m.20812 type:complete len:227 (+) Transcript_7213:174-854(+)
MMLPCVGWGPGCGVSVSPVVCAAAPCCCCCCCAHVRMADGGVGLSRARLNSLSPRRHMSTMLGVCEGSSSAGSGISTAALRDDLRPPERETTTGISPDASSPPTPPPPPAAAAAAYLRCLRGGCRSTHPSASPSPSSIRTRVSSSSSDRLARLCSRSSLSASNGWKGVISASRFSSADCRASSRTPRLRRAWRMVRISSRESSSIWCLRKRSEALMSLALAMCRRA